eukprot:8613494-Pyramimonas_sp.AAC.1
MSGLCFRGRPIGMPGRSVPAQGLPLIHAVILVTVVVATILLVPPHGPSWQLRRFPVLVRP